MIVPKNKKAFTLIEILIALTIFSFTMVMIAGIFSSVLGNQSLIKTSSNLSREAQKIMRQITDDAIDATKKGKIISSTGASNPVEGFLFFDSGMKIISSGDLCKASYSQNLAERDAIGQSVPCVFADGIAFFTNNGIKAYRFKAFSGSQYGDIEYAFVPNSFDLTVNNSNTISTAMDFNKLNSQKTEVGRLKFWGFGCYSNNCDQSPYSQIFLTLQTRNYDNLSSEQRSYFNLKTRISKRSYN